MRLKAYILAADPNWIEASVLAYYDWVEEIIVSYDQAGEGWTGQPIPVEECLRRVRAIDRSRKCRYVAGAFYRPDCSPMENDTHQRQCALDEIGNTADWILEIDTDEILPHPAELVNRLADVPKDCVSIEWPMRPFFQRTRSGKFLEVTTYFRQRLSEYPGPIATRPGVRLKSARCADSAGHCFQLGRPRQLNRSPSSVLIPYHSAIQHLSWVRSEPDILAKLRSWSHARDFRSEDYFRNVWKPAPYKWPLIYNFHPIRPNRWKALWPVRLPGLI